MGPSSCLWKQALSLSFYSSKNQEKKNVDVVHTTVIFGRDSSEGVSDGLQ